MLRRLSRLFGFESRLAQRERLRRARPTVEWLEDRLTPAAVTSPAPDVSHLLALINQFTQDGPTNTYTIDLTGSSYDFTSAAPSSDGNGPNALPVITVNLTINGGGAVLTRDDDAGPMRFFEVASNASLTLNDLTLSNGEAEQDTNGPYGWGGAILTQDQSTLTLTNVILQNNQAVGQDRQIGNKGAAAGGAIYVNGITNATVTLTNCTLESNTARAGHGNQQGGSAAGGPGGSAYGGGFYVNTGTVTLNNCVITNNHANGGDGGRGGDGGLFTLAVGDGGPGGSGQGGGLYVHSGTVHLTDDVLSSNTAQGGTGGHGSSTGGIGTGGTGGTGGSASGGGLYVLGGAVTLTDDTLSSNNATGGAGGDAGADTPFGTLGGPGGTGGTGGEAQGGGLFAQVGTVILANDTLYANQATGGAGGNGASGRTGGDGGSGQMGQGGGVYAAGGSVTLTSDTIADNTASGNGTRLVTVSKGAATFTNIAFFTPGTYTLKATSGSLASASTTDTVVKDVSKSVTITPGPMTGVTPKPGIIQPPYYQTVTITNNSTSTLPGPLALVLPEYSMLNYGTSGTGSFLTNEYLDIPSSSSVAPGASVAVTIYFEYSPPFTPGTKFTQVLEGI
jgi:hypothetical protein